MAAVARLIQEREKRLADLDALRAQVQHELVALRRLQACPRLLMAKARA